MQIKQHNCNNKSLKNKVIEKQKEVCNPTKQVNNLNKHKNHQFAKFGSITKTIFEMPKPKLKKEIEKTR